MLRSVLNENRAFFFIYSYGNSPNFTSLYKKRNMRLLDICLIVTITLSLFSCGTMEKTCKEKYPELEVTGSLEVTNYSVEKIGAQTCSIHGEMIDENSEPILGMTIHRQDPLMGTTLDPEGSFDLKNIPPGEHTFIFRYPGMSESTITLDLVAGDRVQLDGIIGPFDSQIRLEKPIIYLYPEETTKINVSLQFDGALTTTYPKYPKDGWKVTAKPDGTLTDPTGKEYYSLYWEGKPRKPLAMTNGFVVSKEEIVPFLEEKLALLGLTPREANEFIIFWLPTLEKNAFNAIHFSGNDYLEQAQLTITPAPETMIRIAMVFQGLDAPIEIPEQDLTPLQKSRKGFTVVEWGGQEIPKSFSLRI